MQLPPDFPTSVIPLMGMVTGIISMVVIGFVIVKVAQSALGQAVARRISGRAGAGDQELREEVMELRELVSHLEQRLAEGEERIDFAERLLARGKDEAATHG
jgi:hypothetical protein